MRHSASAGSPNWYQSSLFSPGASCNLAGRSPQISSANMEKNLYAMESGHRVCKLALMRKWDPTYKKISLNRETRQLILTSMETGYKNWKSTKLDLRSVKEVKTLEFVIKSMRVADKWSRDKDIKHFDMSKILILTFGSAFNLSSWILLFDSGESCHMWCQGVHYLMLDTVSASHSLLVERWLRKEFYRLTDNASDFIAIKHMKPFVQTSLQLKVQSKQLQEVCEEKMYFDAFATAYRKLLHSCTLFSERFSAYSDDGAVVSFNNFLRFQRDFQNDDLFGHREQLSNFLRSYLKVLDVSRDIAEPSLSVHEFFEFLFSRENSIWDPVNEIVVHDMNRPLSHYWIDSSHNTYLTGDQLTSESSIDAYARALLMGCRCIELDCWDGQKRGCGEVQDIVIYHGYTMTSKLNLRDVLYTIRHYAFINSEYPVILSIEDNCSVSAQRLLAREVKEILGDLLLTSPVSREETSLPSPASMKRKIILKHKKIPIENEEISQSQIDEDQDYDILGMEFTRRGILHLRNEGTDEWTSHVFVLFPDRLCYILDQCDCSFNRNSLTRQDSLGNVLDEESQDDTASLIGFGVRPEEMHVTEEWFHGKTNRDDARDRLIEHKDRGNGLFLVRDSTIFIGDYSLSFLHDEQVHHCRIRTRMVNGEKKFFFLENKQMDTLYELISHYTKEKLKTPNFSTSLVTPCPQPCPHIGMPWFCDMVDRKRAEELLSMVNEDGAFLIRYSNSDKSVFVLSLRVDGEIWHYRLKRDGRIFVVNQTVFENLNQIVHYYATREFVRGICLKISVNEDIANEYLAAGANSELVPSCYMELKDIDKEVLARALASHIGTTLYDLSFPANAVITVLRKDGDRWRGKYGGRTGFFPSRYVVELDVAEYQPNESLSYFTIDLADSLIEEVSYDSADRAFAFRIKRAAAHWNPTEVLLAASSKEDRDDWLNILYELTRKATDRSELRRSREKNLRIASELSNLVVYCQAVPFNSHFATEGNFYEMCSFSESKHEKLMERGLVQFNARQLSRVYPQGCRVTSANYDPMPMWNSACHMAALNFQTGDRAMQLNQGKFMANGQCGYVLKPSYMIDEMFSPDAAEVVTASCPVTLIVQVLAGYHLSRKDRSRGICSPFVTVEIVGLSADSSLMRTHAIASNGLNPIWNDTFSFNIHCPELALIRFYVEDGDFIGPKMDPFIGQAVYPLDCIRTGFRSVNLRNSYSEELELSSLLVHIDMKRQNGDGTTLNPHHVLQAGRSLMTVRKTSSSGVFSARLNSVEQSNFAPLLAEDSGSCEAVERNGIAPTPPSQKKVNAFKKIFKFGKN